jgi:heavy metal translocating P-type ATPase
VRREPGVDLIALLAMASALAVDEGLAAMIVAVMLTGGHSLEAFAAHRARSDLASLLERAPRIAHRRVGETWQEVPVDDLAAGDLVLVRAGEIVPVDGVLTGGRAVLDESTMTGESLPVSREMGDEVRSGVANAGEAFELTTERPAEQSAYAALVRLVGEAESERPPFVRLADRYAAIFLPFTLGLAGIAWAASGDPVRAVAVLVVATPCPLIIAAPVALVAGLSRSARSGVIVKGGGVLERLGEAKTVLFDKTGTLTVGAAVVQAIVPAVDDMPASEVLRLAASLDQLSAHVLAEALVAEAESRGLELMRPVDVIEQAGEGVAGTVGEHSVAVGSRSWLNSLGFETDAALARLDGQAGANGFAHVWVGADAEAIAVIVMADELRPDAAQTVARLRNGGVTHIAMVTGDHTDTAERIAGKLGLDHAHSGLAPGEKVDVVRRMKADPATSPVVMVGDGVNDAPALALADVGIALAQRGATVSAETADAVIAVDRVSRVADAVEIGQRTLRIARQSVIAGIGMSSIAMVVAALGYLPPVAGALLQEAIDVAVILNALRALRG